MHMPIDLKASLRRNVRLSGFTSMQAGGPARYFAEPVREAELTELLEFARQEGLPWMILGKGSNVLFPDEGFPGLVITLIHFEQDLLKVDPEKCLLSASAGVHLYRLVLQARDAGLSGAEFLCNVPGTLGGALVMNAGFSRFPGQRCEIGALVEEVVVLDAQGDKEVLARDRLHFSYRQSNLDSAIVLSATLKLWRRDRDHIEREIRANFANRNEKQDLRYPSSGSVFKNPPPPAPQAAVLIEKAGCKGWREGGAMVSPKHSNTIVNVGRAKSSEIRQLIEAVQKAVLDATGVHLEPEIRIIQTP